MALGGLFKFLYFTISFFISFYSSKIFKVSGETIYFKYDSSTLLFSVLIVGKSTPERGTNSFDAY